MLAHVQAELKNFFLRMLVAEIKDLQKGLNGRTCKNLIWCLRRNFDKEFGGLFSQVSVGHIFLDDSANSRDEPLFYHLYDCVWEDIH